MSTSDSLLFFIQSSLDLNFALLLSSHDDVASLKKKAEAQHLDLFPHKGKIVAQYIKIMLEGKAYSLSDSLPVSCLFDGAKGTLYMDAMTVPPSPPKTHATVLDPRENSLCKRRVLSQGDPSSGGDPIEGLLNLHNNTSCTSESFKRKSLEGSANMDSVLGEVNQGADVLGELAGDKGKQKISKDPFFDEVPPSNERESPKRGDRMRESSVASENETAGEHLEGPPSLADNPGDPFSGGDPIAGLLNQGTNTSCTTESFKRKSLEGSANMDSVLGELAEHKGKQKILKEPFFDEVLPSNERQSPKRGDKMRESCVASENETAGEHWVGHSSLADNPELPREGMLTYRAQSLGHLTEQLACTTSDKGKAKLHSSAGSSSGSGSRSPNYKRLETHKTQHHGVTIHEPCAASREISRVESSGEEERKRGPSCEKYWSIEGSGSLSEDLEDQLARINQIECDEILARSLQEMDRSLEHFSYQRSAIQIPIRKTEMRFSGPEMEHEMLLLSQLRQEFSSSQADHDKKLELLKELEAIYESRAEMDISYGFDLYRDLFYDEDENVAMTDQAMGATESQINNLPVSTIKEYEGKDACIICLETPSVGSVMRHLPCLHKFHKECVDKWLPLRGSCPVCKLAID